MCVSYFLTFGATSGEERKLWMNFLPVTLKLADQTPLPSVKPVGNSKRLLVGAKGYTLHPDGEPQCVVKYT